jgi:hypothetical protein
MLPCIFCPEGGLQFECYHSPPHRLDSSWLSVSIFRGYLSERSIYWACSLHILGSSSVGLVQYCYIADFLIGRGYARKLWSWFIKFESNRRIVLHLLRVRHEDALYTHRTHPSLCDKFILFVIAIRTLYTNWSIIVNSFREGGGVTPLGTINIY